MKLVIASDLHGSATWTCRLMEAIESECPDRVVLLGDLLYHGPRNDLPEGYAPKKVAALLNGIARSVVAVRGNCDAEVDQMVLDFPCMVDYALLCDNSRTLFLTHGHVPSMTPDDARSVARSAFDGTGNAISAASGDTNAAPQLATVSAYLSGHTHVKILERIPLPRSFPLPRKKTSECTFREPPSVLPAIREGAGKRAFREPPSARSSVREGLGERAATAEDKDAHSGLIMLNPGSVSLPKDGSHSYATYTDGLFALKTLDGETLAELAL